MADLNNSVILQEPEATASEHEELERAAQSDARTDKFAELDAHTRLTMQLQRRNYTEWMEDPPTNKSIGVPTTMGPLEKVTVIPGLGVPINDEDWPTNQGIIKGFVRRILRNLLLNLKDQDASWSSSQEGIDTLKEKVLIR